MSEQQKDKGTVQPFSFDHSELREQQQPKEHCEHECVCHSAIYIRHQGKAWGCPCDREKCKHDTRSRPSPAPAPNGFIPLSFLTMHKSQLFTASDVCALIEQHRAEAYEKGMMESSSPKHDAAIRAEAARQAREDYAKEQQQKTLLTILLDSSEYTNPNSDDEKLQDQRIFRLQVITDNEMVIYELFEEEYKRLESAIKKWVHKTFVRVSKDSLRQAQPQEREQQVGEPR